VRTPKDLLGGRRKKGHFGGAFSKCGRTQYNRTGGKWSESRGHHFASSIKSGSSWNFWAGSENRRESSVRAQGERSTKRFKVGTARICRRPGKKAMKPKIQSYSEEGIKGKAA